MAKLNNFGKGPVTALREVGISYGFVTEAVVEQVKQAYQSGQTFDAVSKSAKFAAEAQSLAAQRVKDELHPLTKLYLSVKEAAVGMWDAIKGPSRRDLLNQQIQSDKVTLESYVKRGDGEKSYAKQLKDRIRLNEELLSADDMRARFEEDNKRRLEAATAVEQKSGSALLDYRKEKWKLLTKEQYAQNRLNQEYTDQYEREALVGESRLAQLEAYYKEWETLRKKDTPREVKDNSLQTEKKK